MKAITLLTLATSFCGIGFAESKKIERKSYEEECRQTSIVCPKEDEELFLKPHLSSGMADLAGKLVLDAGCKCSAWAESLVEEGARVCALDSSKECVDRVGVAIAASGLREEVALTNGNPVALPYEDSAFDAAVSVHVGDELPRTVHKVIGNKILIGGLELHMHEMARVMKEGAVATIVAPASYDVVFSDGSRSDKEVFRHIDKVLGKLNKHPDEQKIVSKLRELEEVNRATFVMRDGELQLVTDMSTLVNGERIWRKEFDAVQESFFHSEEEYLVALANANLHCTEIKRPCFFGNVKYRMYTEGQNGVSQLGTGYIDHNPFTIYTVVKQ